MIGGYRSRHLLGRIGDSVGTLLAIDLFAEMLPLGPEPAWRGVDQTRNVWERRAEICSPNR
jgi:hypothetical protein